MAFLMAGLCIALATTLRFVNALGLVLFILGCRVMPAFYAVRKK